jgi:multiple antibiotic resistance protein
MSDIALPLPVLGSLLFTLMGPVAAMPLFAGATAGADFSLRLRIALAAYGTALITLAVAVFIGAGALAGWGVAPSSLTIAAGLILTLTAIRNVTGGGQASPPAERAPPTIGTGFSPIAIPGLVTPVGVAVLVIFVSYFPSPDDKLAVMGVAAGLMTLNLGAMLAANWFMRVIGPAPLLVLGAVFGVLQVAMGVQWIVSGIMRSPLAG